MRLCFYSQAFICFYVCHDLPAKTHFALTGLYPFPLSFSKCVTVMWNRLKAQFMAVIELLAIIRVLQIHEWHKLLWTVTITMPCLLIYEFTRLYDLTPDLMISNCVRKSMSFVVVWQIGCALTAIVQKQPSNNDIRCHIDHKGYATSQMTYSLCYSLQ